MKKQLLILLSALLTIKASAQTLTTILPTGDTLKFYPKKAITEPPVVTPPGMKTLVMGPEQLANGLYDVSNTIIQLKPGVYAGKYFLKNLNNVIINGLNAATFSTANVRAFQLEGSMRNVTFQNIAFKNCSKQDYIICEFNAISKITYNAEDPNTYWENIKLINITSDNSSTLFHADGGLINDGAAHAGVIKGFSMINCKVVNSPDLAMAVYLGNGLNYVITGNTVDNINTLNDNHNGIFFLRGNGSFVNNRITNHQGNALRSWCFGHTGNEKVIVANNTIVGSRKYSAFEFQAQKENLGTTNFKPVNVEVFNNTAGNLNTLNDWNGVMADVYNLNGGKIIYTNNLGFNMKRSDGRPIDNMLNIQYGTPVIFTNNKYLAKQTDAVNVDLKSLVKGLGAQ